MELKMKKLACLALTATILAGGLATMPAFAASGPLSCNSDTSARNAQAAKQELALKLQLSTKRAGTIDDWNGCLKVQYIDENGHTNTALYDPRSLQLINQLN
jgi:hypothetical protein